MYAAETAVRDIFGGNIENLTGLGYLFKYNVFIYSFFAMVCLSCYASVETRKVLQVEKSLGKVVTEF